MKKILIISDPPTPAKELFDAAKLGKKYNIVHSDSSNGLKSFLVEDPDVILCFAEIGNIGDQYERQQELLEDIKKSVTSEKRLIRVGFTESQDEEEDYLSLPFTKEMLEDVLE